MRSFAIKCKKYFQQRSEGFEIVLYPHKKPNILLHWEGVLYCNSEQGLKHIRNIWKSMGGGRTYSIGGPKSTWKDVLSYVVKMNRQHMNWPVSIGKQHVVIRQKCQQKCAKVEMKVEPKVDQFWEANKPSYCNTIR